MKKKTFDTAIRNRAKFLFIQKSLSPKNVAKELGWPNNPDAPHPQSVSRWAKAKDRETGKDWYEERKQDADIKYLEMSPQNMASLILRKTHEILQSDMDHAKLADALLKMQKIISNMLDPDMQVPVMYRMIEDYVLYSRKNHPDIVTDEFLDSVVGFKNYIRSRIQLDFSS